MANICWFEMRMRGTKADCIAMGHSGIPCYDVRIVGEKGTEEDYMVYLLGECRWSVTSSMVDVDEEETLAAKAKKFNLELEVCGLDESEECSEHFHYKGAEVIKENNLPPYIEAWEIEEGEVEFTEEELQKYTLQDDVYVLKEEFVEHFSFDYDLNEARFDFTMSFNDLLGDN